MKKIYTLMFALAGMYAVVTLPACNMACKQGSGKMATETRKLVGFSKLDISGSYNVVIKQDSVSSVSVTADDNLMQDIKTDVSGDKLRISSKDNICSSGRFVLNINLRDLSAIKTSGAVDIESDGKLVAKDLVIDLSGATKMTLNLNANNVNITGSGLTELNLTGQASSHTIELSGAGHVNALDFIVAKYTIETSGASSFKINVLNELNVNSSGASDIEYRGNPKTIHNDKSGAGSLKKVD
jgi:hypothetical protein